MLSDFPKPGRGLRIGLLGGSFDPAHEGHVHISHAALTRFGLDEVWWLVSPGNPLKANGPAPIEQRLGHARALMRHPRVKVTQIESHLGTRYTVDTVRALKVLYPSQRFVWLMGADNLAQFHLWRGWECIMQSLPLGVLARPGRRIGAQLSVATQKYRHARIAAQSSHALPFADAPAWCFVNIAMSPLSSTQLRSAGHWPRRMDLGGAAVG